jgi:hypothetical protein
MQLGSFGCINFESFMLARTHTKHLTLKQITQPAMAKQPAKKAVAAKAPAKKTPARKAAAPSLEAAAEDLLAKLKALNMDSQLQADLEWCLGSYRHDQNPVGLTEAVRQGVAALKQAVEAKKKGVTTKFVSDMEKALK